MRVLVCGLKEMPAGHGGISRVTEEIHSRLAATGFRVTLFTRDNRESEPCTYRGMEVRPSPFMEHKYLCYFTYMARVFSKIVSGRERDAIVHLHNPAINGLWALLFRLAGYRVVCHTHGLEWRAAKWPPWFGLFMRMSTRLATLASDLFFCVSREECDYLSSTTIRPCACVHLPNGRLASAPRPEDATTRSLGLTPGDFYLYAGRLVPQKAVLELLAGYALARSTRKLVLVGGSSFSDEYCVRVREVAATVAGVVLAGWLPHELLLQLYPACYAFILPSYHEGCPNVLLEALSCGCVCAISDIRSHREIANSAPAFFPAGDVSALAKVLGRLERDKPYYAARKAACEATFERLPTWDAAADTVAEGYRSLLHA